MKYAVIEQDSIYHEGDERSRTNPGHGYPAYSETIQRFRTFNTLEELKKWIRSNERATFTAIQFEELTIIKEIELKITKHP